MLTSLKSNHGINELIETLWNVNEEKFVVLGSDCVELIETLWNVNKK